MQQEVQVQQGGFQGKVTGCFKIGIDISSGKLYLIDNNNKWKQFTGTSGGGGVYTEGADIDIDGSNVISNTSTLESVIGRSVNSNSTIGFNIGNFSTTNLVVITTPVNAGFVREIVIDQTTCSIGLRNGNSDNNLSTIERRGNNVGELRLTSKNATDGSAVPTAGFITHYAHNSSGAAILKQQMGRATNDNIGVMNAISSGSADPTTTDIPAGMSAVWKNTTSGDIKLWVNDGGSMKASVALS